MLYVQKAITRFLQLTKLNVTPYCITDRPTELPKGCIAIRSDPDSKGWWNKVNLFSPEMPKGWNFYLDIDTVLLRNFDDEIKWAIAKNPKMACVSDAIGWMGCKFSSSFMIFESGSQSKIYENYMNQKNNLQDFAGGDQVWVGPQLDEILYLDEFFPNLKRNLKFHIATNISNEGSITLPNTISDDIKIIDCGGRPKPDELGMLSYIKKNWHDILV